MIFKSKKQKVLSITLLLALVGTGGTAIAEDTQENSINERIKIEEISQPLISKQVLRAGSHYDLRDYRYLYDADKGGGSLNWATATLRALEYSDNNALQFSASDVDTQTAMNGKVPYYRTAGSGGNSALVLGYMTSGNGPKVGSSDNVNIDSAFYSIKDITKFKNIYKYIEYGQNYIWDGKDYESYSYTTGDVEKNRDAIKDHIINYGAVVARIYRESNDSSYWKYNYTSGMHPHEIFANYRIYDGDGDYRYYTYKTYDYNEQYWNPVPGGKTYDENGVKYSTALSYYYNGNKNAKPNHEVVIIGWDDEYTNAYTGAPGKGAYIAVDADIFQKDWVNYRKCNKSGRCTYESKITTKTNVYYISYYDYFVESNVYGIGEKKYASGIQNIYQYDELGMSSSISNDSIGNNVDGTSIYDSDGATYGANVFIRNNKNMVEQLKEISVASEDAEKYEVYVNPKNGDLNKNDLIKVASTDILPAGYHTIKMPDGLDNRVLLTGEKFAVVVKYIKDDSRSTYDYNLASIGIESPTENYTTTHDNGKTYVVEKRDIDYWQTAKSSPGQSYVSGDMTNWIDLYSNSGTIDANICIKAFTTDLLGQSIPADKIEVTNVGLNEVSSINLIKGDTLTLIGELYPDNVTIKKIFWYSNDKSVVTIDNNGYVTAVGGGKTKIRAVSGDGKITKEIDVNVTVPIQSYVLSQKEVTILENNTYILAGIIQPEDATTKDIKWTSSNKNVVLVTDDGMLIGLAQGRATVTGMITERYPDGSKKVYTQTCAVTVPKSLNVGVGSVSLDKTSLTMEKGTRQTLVPIIQPADATNQSVVWTSSNKNVATVNANGRVTAIAPGTATITVTTVNNGEQATCLVTVKEAAVIPVKSVGLNKTSITMEKGKIDTLVPTIMPLNATNKNVIWTSSDSRIAMVDAKGVVTAVDPGTATITATTVDGNKTATATITVTKPYVNVTDIRLNKSAVLLNLGKEDEKTYELVATVLPYDASNPAVIWTSDDTNVATVDSNGKVTAVGVGTTYVNVKSVDSGETKNCIVKVEKDVPMTDFKVLDKDGKEITGNIELKEGLTTKAYIGDVTPADSTNKEVKWTSSNENIAIVTDGRIYAVPEQKSGEDETAEAPKIDRIATITAKSEDGTIVKTFDVKVLEETSGLKVETPYTIEKSYSTEDYGIMMDIEQNTSIDDFKKNLFTQSENEATIKVCDMEGNEITDGSKFIGTGMVVVISTEKTDGTTSTTITQKYPVIVKGDIITKNSETNKYEAGDGQITAKDYEMARKIVVEEEKLEGTEYEQYLKALDYNGNGKIDSIDLAIMQDSIIG